MDRSGSSVRCTKRLTERIPPKIFQFVFSSCKVHNLFRVKKAVHCPAEQRADRRAKDEQSLKEVRLTPEGVHRFEKATQKVFSLLNLFNRTGKLLLDD